MDDIEEKLQELLHLAETPLYSAFRWLGSRISPVPTWAEFLDRLQDLMDADSVRLWHTDALDGDHTELFELPIDLPDQYEDQAHEDASFDPLGLTLTLGTKASEPTPPPWSLDVNYAECRFSIHATHDSEDAAWSALERECAGTRAIRVSRSVEADRVVIVGILASE